MLVACQMKSWPRLSGPEASRRDAARPAVLSVARMRRTTASRRWNTAWNRFWLFPGATALALAAIYGGGVQASFWLAGLVLVAAGATAGVLAARDESTRGPVPALLAPIPVLILAGVLMLASSESASDHALVASVIGTALLLFDVPLAAAYRYTSARRTENLVGTSDTTKRNRELDVATDHGRSTIVVREYRADAEGREHLAFDTAALRARGYTEVAVDSYTPHAARVGAEFVIGLAAPVGVSEAKLIASFARDSIALDDWKLKARLAASNLSTLKFGCLSAALIAAWTIAGLATIPIWWSMFGALSPGRAGGDPVADTAPLVALAVAFAGSILSIRWLRTKS